MKKTKGIFIAAALVAVLGAFNTNLSAKKLLAVYTNVDCYNGNVTKPDECKRIASVVCTISGITYYNKAGCLDVLMKN